MIAGLLPAAALVFVANGQKLDTGTLRTVNGAGKRYGPYWPSLDTRVAPAWYDKAKIGIFIHWGVFSVPAFRSEWFWWDWMGSKEPDVVDFMKKNYPPNWKYANFAAGFRAEFFNASEWANLFARAGARYVVLTSKHHEGFTLWPSETAFSWNSQDVGPARDLVGELAAAVRATPVRRSKAAAGVAASGGSGDDENAMLRFGVYHSLFEWFNPLYLQDKAAGFKTQEFVKTKTLPELYELVLKYQPEIIWSDGDWDALDEYWNSTHFLAWLYNDSPVRNTVLVNDRWGRGTEGKHGDFFNVADRFNPGTLQAHKWENAMTLDRNSWGYRRTMNIGDVLSFQELLTTLAQTISCGGNLLVNVGPRADGRIDAIFEERLLQLGAWLDLNGEAVYDTKPWSVAQNDSINPFVWYTDKPQNATFAIVLDLPEDGWIRLGSLGTVINPLSTLTRLEDNTMLKFGIESNAVFIQVPPRSYSNTLPTSAFAMKIVF